MFMLLKLIYKIPIKYNRLGNKVKNKLVTQQELRENVCNQVWDFRQLCDAYPKGKHG